MPATYLTDRLILRPELIPLDYKFTRSVTYISKQGVCSKLKLEMLFRVACRWREQATHGAGKEEDQRRRGRKEGGQKDKKKNLMAIVR